jgi:hypothetical protein
MALRSLRRNVPANVDGLCCVSYNTSSEDGTIWLIRGEDVNTSSYGLTTDAYAREVRVEWMPMYAAIIQREWRRLERLKFRGMSNCGGCMALSDAIGTSGSVTGGDARMAG